MPSKPKKRRVKPRARAPEGKRQVLIIMDHDVIKLSHAVEKAVRDWLSKRKREKAASNAV